MRTNERGNTIYDDHEADARLQLYGAEARYFYDEHLCSRGWKQYDTRQDAWYFGVWVQTELYMTFTYAEGDRILVVCPSLESFRAELEDAERVYGPAPPCMIAYDMSGQRTEYYDTRPTA